MYSACFLPTGSGACDADPVRTSRFPDQKPPTIVLVGGFLRSIRGFCRYIGQDIDDIRLFTAHESDLNGIFQPVHSNLTVIRHGPVVPDGGIQRFHYGSSIIQQENPH